MEMEMNSSRSSGDNRVIDWTEFITSSGMAAQRTREMYGCICFSDHCCPADRPSALTKPADDSLTVGVAIVTSH